MNFQSLISLAIRSILTQNGAMNCSDLVRAMGLNPAKHKGTIHAIMVQLEKQGVLDSTKITLRNGKERRDLWMINKEHIRKRDRLVAAMFAWDYHNLTPILKS